MTSQLFSPISLRGLTLPNRIVVSPMCQYSAENGSASDWHLAHLGQLSLSGAGLLITEATAVEARGRITHHDLGLYSDENEAALARVVAFCRRHGSARLGAQLAHAGRKASAHRPWEGRNALGPGEDPWETIAPSPVPVDENWPTPRMMDRTDMDALTAAFIDTTRRADRIGLDMLELHTAHGYLLNTFLSPLSNRRDDEYGGSRENRMRYPLEVFEAIRRTWPAEKPIGVRVSAVDGVEGGWDIADSVAFAGALKELGCDYVVASAGGVAPGRQKFALRPGYQVPYAAEIRRKTGIATMAVGMIRDPSHAEEIVADGHADMVALARGMLYEPRWAWHAAEELGAEAIYPPQYERAAPAKWREAFQERSAAAE